MGTGPSEGAPANATSLKRLRTPSGGPSPAEDASVDGAARQSILPNEPGSGDVQLCRSSSVMFMRAITVAVNG